MLSVLIEMQAQPAASDTPAYEPGNEMVIMYKGHVWHRQEGRSVIVSAEVTIGDFKVTGDGTVIFPDRTTTRLNEGDFIEAGKIYRSSKSSQP